MKHDSEHDHHECTSATSTKLMCELVKFKEVTLKGKLINGYTTSPTSSF